jgi:outer membrane protein assembly factor BamB
VVLTLALLPYAWGRVFVIALMVDRPEWLFLGLLIAGILLIILLSYHLAPAFDKRSWHRRFGWAMASAWMMLNGVLVAISSGDLLPRLLVLVLFLPATLWVPWAAWMCYRPLRWSARLGILALLVAIGVECPLLLRVEGLTGDARVNFAWRYARPSERPVEVPAGTTADLLHPTAHDYPQFLGPLRQAILPEAHLARDWKNHPPRERWRHAVGAGWSSFAIVGDFAITQEQRAAEECVVCYRVSDGSPVWLHADPVRFDSSMGGPGPRATPTIADGRVYTVGATGLLNCLDGATGQAIWSVDILKDNGAENLAHGVCASPLVLDNRVIVCPTGNKGPSLVAYDRDTGQRLWQQGKDQASYVSPLVAELVGVHQILLGTAVGVTGHDAKTGAVLWSFPWTNSTQVNCAEPIPNADGPGQVFFSSGYGKGCVLLRVAPATDGSWSATPIWESRAMKTKFTTPVIHNGFVYGLDDGILECVDLKTGKSRWKEGRYQHGQILLAGDLLLVQAENGTVVLVEPMPEGLHELGRIRALSSKTWNHPALAGRFLLVRNDQEAACYELPLEDR